MDIYQQSIITDTNLRYFEVDMSSIMDKTGGAIAELLLKRYGPNQSYAFVCGLGNNGGDGFAAARHLAEKGIKNIKVYLVGRTADMKTPSAKHHWEELLKTDVKIKQDAFGKDIEKADVIVECLLGTELKDKLYKRFHDVVYRITRLKSNLVTVDNPAPGYKWDYSISIMYPKTADAEVIPVNIPDNALQHVGPGEVKLIAQPRRHSYKQQNGKVLIVGGSNKYHGAPVIAAQAAANYAGLVYLYTPIKDQQLLREMDKMSVEFINVTDDDLQSIAEQVDCILIGPGLAINLPNKALVQSLQREFISKKFVIDAGAMTMMDVTQLAQNQQTILTPHRGELKHLFADLEDKKISETSLIGRVKRYTIANKVAVNLKSSTSILFNNNGEFKFNISGNAGMAKGGSGDALAGLTAAFATVNGLWLAMTAAAFVNGIAGELAAREFGPYYSVEELIKYQQLALKYCYEF